VKKTEIVQRLIDEGFGLDKDQNYVVLKAYGNTQALVEIEQLAEFCEKLHEDGFQAGLEQS